VAKETASAHLLTMHNVYWMLQMMHEVRGAIVKGEFPGYLQRRFQWWYPVEYTYSGLLGLFVLGCPSSGREIDFFWHSGRDNQTSVSNKPPLCLFA